MREERVIGTVTTDARIDPETGNETHGRISYENRGECFFLPFTTSDVEGNVTVAAGDKVSFQVRYVQSLCADISNPLAQCVGVVHGVQDPNVASHTFLMSVVKNSKCLEL